MMKIGLGCMGKFGKEVLVKSKRNATVNLLPNKQPTNTNLTLVPTATGEIHFPCR